MAAWDYADKLGSIISALIAIALLVWKIKGSRGDARSTNESRWFNWSPNELGSGTLPVIAMVLHLLWFSDDALRYFEALFPDNILTAIVQLVDANPVASIAAAVVALLAVIIRWPDHIGRPLAAYGKLFLGFMVLLYLLDIIGVAYSLWQQVRQV